MVGLPWHTEVVKSEGSLQDVIVAEGNGVPGFRFQCTTAGLSVTDTCTAEKLNTAVTNASGGVDQAFNAEKLNCKPSIGGENKEAGALVTTQLIEATKGSALEANIVEGAYSRLTSSVAVKAEGELLMEDRGEEIAIKCLYTLEGSVGAGAKGTFTTMAGSKCTEPAKMQNDKGEEVSNLMGRRNSWKRQPPLEPGTEWIERKGDGQVPGGAGREICLPRGRAEKRRYLLSVGVSPELENGLVGNCSRSSLKDNDLWKRGAKTTAKRAKPDGRENSTSGPRAGRSRQRVGARGPAGSWIFRSTFGGPLRGGPTGACSREVERLGA